MSVNRNALHAGIEYLLFQVYKMASPFWVGAVGRRWKWYDGKLKEELISVQVAFPTGLQLGPNWGQLGPTEANWGPTEAQPGPNLGPTGTQLGPTGAQLGPNWNAAWGCDMGVS